MTRLSSLRIVKQYVLYLTIQFESLTTFLGPRCFHLPKITQLNLPAVGVRWRQPACVFNHGASSKTDSQMTFRSLTQSDCHL